MVRCSENEQQICAADHNMTTTGIEIASSVNTSELRWARYDDAVHQILTNSRYIEMELPSVSSALVNSLHKDRNTFSTARFGSRQVSTKPGRQRLQARLAACLSGGRGARNTERQRRRASFEIVGLGLAGPRWSRVFVICVKHPSICQRQGS